MYAQHFIVGNSLYNHLLSLILRKIPNRLPKMVFALSVEHDLRAENIGSIIILDVNMVWLMVNTYKLISAMTHASFGWWIMFAVFIRYSLCILVSSVWFSQLPLWFFKHSLKSYMFASYCYGWNLMRLRLIYAASLHKWTA